MITAIVAVGIVMLVIALVVAVARDPGPPPADVALAYEEAWDRLDFESLWALSGDELRDGLGRKQFVAAKSAAYARQSGLGQLASEITVEDLDAGESAAVAHTRVDLRDGSIARNVIELAKRAGRWAVVAYRLHSDAPPAG
jgi:hypothetical protein